MEKESLAKESSERQGTGDCNTNKLIWNMIKKEQPADKYDMSRVSGWEALILCPYPSQFDELILFRHHFFRMEEIRGKKTAINF